MKPNVTKEEIYTLTDEQLVHALTHIRKSDVTAVKLSPWETTFLATAPMQWARCGFTWKQRRAARHLVLKVCETLQRIQALP
jgi:hypothetical protein